MIFELGMRGVLFLHGLLYWHVRVGVAFSSWRRKHPARCSGETAAFPGTRILTGLQGRET